MPSERTDGVLRDILHHIDLATQFVIDIDREAFKADIRTVYGDPLPGDHLGSVATIAGRAKVAASANRMAAKMAAAGNIYRHDYEDVLAQLVWDTVQRALPSLRSAIAQEIEHQK